MCFRCGHVRVECSSAQAHRSRSRLRDLAGLSPMGVLCEFVNDDGTVQRLPQLVEFKARLG